MGREALGYCRSTPSQRSHWLLLLRPELWCHLLYRRGKGVIDGPSPLRIYVLEQLCSACGRNGMGGLDLLLPPPPPCSAPGMPGPQAGLGCAIPGRRPRQLTTKCLDQRLGPPVPTQPVLQCCRLGTPSLVTSSSQSGSGDTQVNRQSQLRGVNVLIEEVLD